jgi:hypothetical protein
MTTAVDKWPACTRLLAVAPAGHLPTALTPLLGTRPAPAVFRLLMSRSQVSRRVLRVRWSAVNHWFRIFGYISLS